MLSPLSMIPSAESDEVYLLGLLDTFTQYDSIRQIEGAVAKVAALGAKITQVYRVVTYT